MVKFTKDLRTGNVTVHNTQRTLGSLERGIDGFYVYWPEKEVDGCYDEYFLQIILDNLKELNKPIQKELEEYFSKEKNQ